MKKNETYEKLPYSSPAINVISLQDRLATICASGRFTGDTGSGGVGGGLEEVGDGQW